ncbi:helix-turn-helix transcriptional regulator [Streptomyces sp. NPDC048825]|uniref:helix-turn-helix transcriptional regulator n=1 Tax=Streptomyces sp. NPDC048825 TaxID=3365592 RepID=UPI0037198217
MNKAVELGHALRTWRDRLDPTAVGFPAGRNRRTPGLRREELALLAGISADYIMRLEQGRVGTPSAQILNALTRALRLSEQERRHLFILAGKQPPNDGQVTAWITPSVRRLIDQMQDVPLGVYDAIWNLIAWNGPFAALLGDPSEASERERNVLWSHFHRRPTTVTHEPHEETRFEQAVVADLRAATALYPADARVADLVAELSETSAHFVELWNSHAVGVHSTCTKTVHHPEIGPLTLDCDVLTVPGNDLRVVVFTAPPHTDSASELRRVVSTERYRTHEIGRPA